MRTLNDLSELKETGFGRPPPRHGLVLLWWFAHECVQIKSNDRMIAQCNPANGSFGFHHFQNRERILPRSKLPYYEVGNLHITNSLPRYVTKDNTGRSDNSNTDRIIVCFNSGLNLFDSIYVTRHSDLVKFDQNHTYCISVKLIKDIKNLNREDFLRGPIPPKRPAPSEHYSIDMNNVMPRVPTRPSHTSQPVQSESRCVSKKCCCVLICVLILLLIIAAASVVLWFKLK